MLGGLAESPFDLLVALVADQDDVVVLFGEAHGLPVDFRDQGTGRVDGGEPAHSGGLVDLRGDAVGGEDDARALGDLVGLLHEDGPAFGQGLDDELVVDDLLAHVDGGSVELERFLDDVDRAIDPRAVASGRCQQDAPASCGPSRFRQ